jgi:hypothetical protein
MYVAPALPLAGQRDHLCFSINAMTLNSVREVMTRAKFIGEVAGEFADLLAEDEDDGAEEDDEVACSQEGCEEDVAYVCTCQVCEDDKTPAEKQFTSCASHRAPLDPIHLQANGRPAKWEKIPDDDDDDDDEAQG